MIGYLIFGKDDLFSCFLIGMGFALSAYIIIKNNLSKLPDVNNDDEINKLRP